jgi:hypothetical protein
LLWSTNDLRERLKERQTLIVTSEAHLQLQIKSLRERESLAIRCMIARDAYHLLALYELFAETDHFSRELKTTPFIPTVPPVAAAEPEPVVTFSEWLFADETESTQRA